MGSSVWAVVASLNMEFYYEVHGSRVSILKLRTPLVEAVCG